MSNDKDQSIIHQRKKYQISHKREHQRGEYITNESRHRRRKRQGSMS